jgi:hypothetical protein
LSVTCAETGDAATSVAAMAAASIKRKRMEPS